MSTLTVVRHGQARPFEKDSDRLSETGELQARALAEYWSRNGITFDEVWSGSLQRHRQTAALALAKAPTISADWNEYDAEGILRDRPPAHTFPDNRSFQKAFETAMLNWVEAVALKDGVEPWSVFRDRVRRGLRSIQDGPPNRRVVLFTSGGPIGVLIQTALGAPDRSFLDVNWRVRNCSITEFVFSAGRLSLDSFNAIPHLSSEELRTFR
jgi:broad specificity phosphatase PhoE